MHKDFWKLVGVNKHYQRVKFGSLICEEKSGFSGKKFLKINSGTFLKINSGTFF